MGIWPTDNRPTDFWPTDIKLTVILPTDIWPIDILSTLCFIETALAVDLMTSLFIPVVPNICRPNVFRSKRAAPWRLGGKVNNKKQTPGLLDK